MSDEALNDRVEELLDAALTAMGDAAKSNGADGMELILAAQSLAVLFALAGCKSHEDARSAIELLTNDYFGQAKPH